MFTALVTAIGQAWIDFDVYMPKDWAKDPRRRKKAGIPEDLKFATKPELAAEQLKRLMAAGVHALWAAADEVYGRCGQFRDALRALSLAYVVIIPCNQPVTIAKAKVIRADEAIADAVFERRSCGNGEKGPRYSDRALVATADPREFLLIRRLPAREKNQYTFYLCWAPEGRPATMTYFVTIARRRWPVDREGHPGLGPVPGQDLGRDLPAYRPDRARPAQGRRGPRRPHRRRRPPRRTCLREHRSCCQRQRRQPR